MTTEQKNAVVIEDDVFAQRTIKRKVKELGVEIVKFVNSLQLFLQLIEDSEFLRLLELTDYVFIDNNLPNMSRPGTPSDGDIVVGKLLELGVSREKLFGISGTEGKPDGITYLGKPALQQNNWQKLSLSEALKLK